MSTDGRCETCDMPTGVGYSFGNIYCCTKCLKVFKEFLKELASAQRQGVDIINLLRELTKKFSK